MLAAAQLLKLLTADVLRWNRSTYLPSYFDICTVEKALRLFWTKVHNCDGDHLSDHILLST
jgi:hypothetical protein